MVCYVGLSVPAYCFTFLVACCSCCFDLSVIVLLFSIAIVFYCAGGFFYFSSCISECIWALLNQYKSTATGIFNLAHKYRGTLLLFWWCYCTRIIIIAKNYYYCQECMKHSIGVIHKGRPQLHVYGEGSDKCGCRGGWFTAKSGRPLLLLFLPWCPDSRIFAYLLKFCNKIAVSYLCFSQSQ